MYIYTHRRGLNRRRRRLQLLLQALHLRGQHSAPILLRFRPSPLYFRLHRRRLHLAHRGGELRTHRFELRRG